MTLQEVMEKSNSNVSWSPPALPVFGRCCIGIDLQHGGTHGIHAPATHYAPKNGASGVHLAPCGARARPPRIELEDSDRIVQLSDLDRIVTVDSCQGSESRTVIISCVRSNPQGHIGFTGDPNRLNVAISRPKEALYIVGNRDTFKHMCKGAPKNPGWFNLIAAIDALSSDHTTDTSSRLSHL